MIPGDPKGLPDDKSQVAGKSQVTNKCIDCNIEISRNGIRCASCSNKNRKGKYYLSKKAKINMSKAAIGRIGEKNGNWQGGISEINNLLRGSSLYKIWKETVFLRDNFTCQDCGQFGGNLEVHHIKPFAKYPEFRFKIDNGITYCISCHAKNDTQRRIKNVA